MDCMLSRLNKTDLGLNNSKPISISVVTLSPQIVTNFFQITTRFERKEGPNITLEYEIAKAGKSSIDYMLAQSRLPWSKKQKNNACRLNSERCNSSLILFKIYNEKVNDLMLLLFVIVAVLNIFCI